MKQTFGTSMYVCMLSCFESAIFSRDPISKQITMSALRKQRDTENKTVEPGMCVLSILSFNFAFSAHICMYTLTHYCQME